MMFSVLRSKKIIFVGLVALFATAYGCSGEQIFECVPGACQPNGQCVLENGGAVCDCDDGYQQHATALICEEEDIGGGEDGEECATGEDCDSGWCLKFGDDPTGYCSSQNCNNDSECVNHALDGAEMCCTELDAGFYACLKLAPGCACGNGDGTCGTSCTCTIDSACDPMFPCLRATDTDPDAICSHQCATDNDCSDCTLEDPNGEVACQMVLGGEKYCLVNTTEYCTTSLDCPGDGVCVPEPNAEETELFGACGRYGDLDPGSVCNDDDDPGDLAFEERCAGYYCMYGMCSEVCAVDNDCPPLMTCELMGFINIPGATIGLCFGPPPVGTSPPGGPCPFGDYNADADDCMGGGNCLGYDADQLGLECETVEDCIAGGLPEAENPDCQNGLCNSTFCAVDCDENDECSVFTDPATGDEYPLDAFIPGMVGDSCMCMPGQFGDAEAGDPCPFGQTHADADDCGPGMACLGYEVNDGWTCAIDGDCEQWISVWENPDCVDGACGASFCSPACDENDSCPDGFSPAMVGSQCYCIPVETGDQGPGDPCRFGDVHNDAGACQPGLSCLGYDPVSMNHNCTVADDCLEWITPWENPFCTADGLCGASFCSPPCDENNECEDGFQPGMVGSQCYCMPVEIGDSGPGDPCPFSGVHADASPCQAGMACLGYDTTTLGEKCTVDADCDPFVAAWENPVCHDGWCGGSFCSPRCDEDNLCEPPFYPGLVSGSCYCIPGPEGASVAGDACPVDGYNEAADYCIAGLWCVNFDPTVLNKPCNLDDDCLQWVMAWENPSCVNNLCSGSFCADRCDANDECGLGFLPDFFDGNCFCKPAETGAAVAGEACILDLTNPDTDMCASGLMCVGVQPDATVACAGGEDSECVGLDIGDNTVLASWNADCVANECAYSYCAAPCTGDPATCDPGFAVSDVGGDCFCAPE